MQANKPATNTTDGEQKPTILLIAVGSDSRHELRGLLESQGYEVYARDSRIRAFQLMTVYLIDLVVVDMELQDGSGIDFCREFRSDPNFTNIPVVVVGEDDENATTCIQAFETGADDFVQVPFVPTVCMLRVKRLINRRLKSRNQVKTSLSVQVTSGELPGILQYLEAEVKTGKLTVKSHKGTAVVHINQGRFANATAPMCEGPEAVTEALSWEESQVTFEEMEVTESDNSNCQQLTSILMNSVVDVDEYREAKKRLPPVDAMFAAGEKRPDRQMPREKVELWDQAVNGYSSDELLQTPTIGERQATLWLHELIDDGYLLVKEPPFHYYTKGCFDHYQRLHYKQRLQNIRKALTEVEFPLPKDLGACPIAPANWISPAAKIVVCGDRPDHVEMVLDSCSKLYKRLTQKTPPEHKNLPGAETRRYDFGDKNVLDVQRLPPILEKRFLKSLDEYLSEVVAVVLVATDQTRRANQMNLRLIRQIRQRFKGVFYNVVPKVPDHEGRSLFKLDCHNCGYRLAVDVDEAGSQGECPICNADVLIPDPLDHLAHSLSLPNDVPIVLVEPSNPLHVRDLIQLLIDTVLYASNPPPQAIATATVIAPEEDASAKGTPAEAMATQVRERAARTVPPPEPAPEPAPMPQIEPLEELPEELPEEPPEEVLEELPEVPPEVPGAQSATGLDLDALLGQDDDFDIDDFIKKVQGE